MTPAPSIERLYELLADRATQGLSPGEQRELKQLLGKWPHVDEAEFDRAAAALDLAMTAVQAPPPGLLTAVRAGASRHFGERERRTALWATWSGWAVAACLAMASWFQRPTPVTVEQQYARLVGRANVLRQVGADGGEVVWDRAANAGFLKLRGLPVNDPKESQYQLWVFDGQRDERFPVDGGVFDVSGVEVIVPVRAKLSVSEPAAFVVTRERPGGVVVSDRAAVVWQARTDR